MFVRPLRPAWTALCPRSRQKAESCAVAGTLLMRVAGIDVLEGDRRAGPLEVVGDRVAQKDADVAVLDVPRRVPLPALRHQILAGAFRDDDHRVASALEPLLQR